LSGILVIIFAIGAFNFTTINYSFNLLKSFPDDISSRVGFELLEENYPAGELAPVTMVMEANEAFELDETFLHDVNEVIEAIEQEKGIDSISPNKIENLDDLPRNFLADNHQAVKLQIILEDNPYEMDAIETVEGLQESGNKIIDKSIFSDIHFAGQTAEQLDVKNINDRDTLVLFTLVTVLLIVVLAFQTKSITLPLLMMGTILLSYFASVGFSWWMFEHLFGLDAISYRLPIYTFVFMVALGIDYNIMLISRIREEAKTYPWKEAVGRGVQLTGGVISSAGIILAATFSVLMTQP